MRDVREPARVGLGVLNLLVAAEIDVAVDEHLRGHRLTDRLTQERRVDDEQLELPEPRERLVQCQPANRRSRLRDDWQHQMDTVWTIWNESPDFRLTGSSSFFSNIITPPELALNTPNLAMITVRSATQVRINV